MDEVNRILLPASRSLVGKKGTMANPHSLMNELHEIEVFSKSDAISFVLKRVSEVALRSGERCRWSESMDR